MMLQRDFGVDLLSLASVDTALPGRGMERHGRCPFCGGTDRFWVRPADNRWFCRRCTPRGGDAISYIRARDHVGYRAALSLVGQAPARPAPPAPLAERLPDEAWRGHADRLVTRWQAALWAPAGARALAWLRARALADETITSARLGYCAADGIDGAWRVHRGITIPVVGVDGALYGIRVRRPVPRDARGGGKYISIRGSSGVVLYGTLRGADTLLITEGYFDCLLAARLLAGVDVATMNLCRPQGRWLRWLLGYGRILVCLDTDEAGAKGWAHWSWIGTARRCGLPAGKDITAAVVDEHVDLAAWLAGRLGGEQADSPSPPPCAPAPEPVRGPARDGWLEAGDATAF